MPEVGCQTDFIKHRPDILKEYREIIDHYTTYNNLHVFAYLESNDITIVKKRNKWKKWKTYYERGCNTVDYLSYSNIIFIDIIDFLERLDYGDPNYLDTILFDGMNKKDFKLKFYD
jgi:hypothetical protein